MADLGPGRFRAPGWSCSCSVVVVLLTFLLSLGFTPPAATSTRVHRVVRNCGADTRGTLTLLLPEQEVSYPRNAIRIEAQVGCQGGLPFGVGVDGVGYGLSDKGRLVPRPQYNPDCQSCWPQLGVAKGAGPFSHSLSASPGAHILTLKPGIQGTDLPRFRPIRIMFEVSPAGLPATGFPVLLLIGTMVILALCGLVSAAIARRTSQGATT